MIRFFRKLRDKMLTENKARRYVIYALGEILLIVIGILIALQINNANSDRQRNELELTILEEMTNNLEEDLADARGNVGWLTDVRNSNLWVLKGLNGEAPFIDTLKQHYARMYQTVNFSKNTSAYRNLESIGLNLISDPNLRETVTNHYTILYDGIKGRSQIHVNLLQNQLLPEILDNVDIDLDYAEGTPADYDALKNNHRLKRIIVYNCAVMEDMIAAYERVVQRIEGLLKELTREIESRNN